MKKYLLLTAATVAAVCWILLSPYLSELSAVGVTAEQAAYANAETTVDCTGTFQVASQQTVSYGYPVMAEKVYVKPGDTVKKGQLLLRIDQNETAAAFATIHAAQAAASTSQADTDSADTSGSDSADSSATDSSAANADIEQYLNGQGGGDINSLLSQYYGSGTSSASSDSDSDSNSAASTETINVPDEIYASVSGVVMTVNASENTFTQPTQPLVVVGDTSHMQIKSQVDESQIANVKTGQTVRISGDAFSGTLSGQVLQIFPTARTVLAGSTSTKTVVDVLIDVQADHSDVKSGMNADTSIVTSSRNEISLPYEALRQDSRNQLYVMVVKNGRAFRQNVATGEEHTDDIAIRSGVKAGDWIILNPPQSLHSGQLVRMSKAKE